MARIVNGTEISRITRKQLKALLRETTAVESATSVRSGMEYTLKMPGGTRVHIIVNDGAETEHDLIIDRKTEISRAQQRERDIQQLVEAQYERNADNARGAHKIEAAIANRVDADTFDALLTEAIIRFIRRGSSRGGTIATTAGVVIAEYRHVDA